MSLHFECEKRIRELEDLVKDLQIALQDMNDARIAMLASMKPIDITDPIYKELTNEEK